MTPEQIAELLRDAQGLAHQAAVMAAKADEMFVMAARAEALADSSLHNLSDEEVEQAIEHLFHLYDFRDNFYRAEIEALMSFGDTLPEDEDSSSNEEYRRRVVRLHRRFTK